MRKCFCLALGFLLTGCTSSHPAVISNNQTSSSSFLFSSDSNEWSDRQLSELPFELQLPKNALVQNDSGKFAGHPYTGADIYSESPFGNPTIYVTKDDYFYFFIGKISGYSQTSQVLDSICTTDTPENPGYKILDTWTQDDILLTRVEGWKCIITNASLSRGIIIQRASDIYLIDLPPGDWGKDGGTYFEKALHSIRYSESSSSSSLTK